MKNKLTFYDSREETLNILTHALGLLLSVVALVLLVVYASLYGDVWHITSFAIFGASLIVLYAASTFYHYATNPEIRLKLNILDHAAIYVLIAGTYTPFALVVLKGWIGWTITRSAPLTARPVWVLLAILVYCLIYGYTYQASTPVIYWKLIWK